LKEISVADTDRKALNLFEFGINRDLCQDPAMEKEPPQKESRIQLLLAQRSTHVVPKAGRRFLAMLKRGLVGLLDQSHPLFRVNEWGGGAPSGSSSLAHQQTATMSLSLATINLLNHSKYLDPPFPGFTLATIGMLNHLQAVVEDVLQNGIEGDLMETGVWRGGQTILMRAILEAASEEKRHVWVCDSFSGVPPPRRDGQQDVEADETVEWEPGLYNASIDMVRANFLRFGLLDERVHFVKGHFVDTMKTVEVEKIAVLRLDADTWDATSDVLEALYDRVSDGGYIIIDDFHLNGARGATLDFRKKRGITDPLLPVPEDYVFACGQRDPRYYHAWPKKLPQGAYWKKGGFRSLVMDDSS